MKPKLGFCRVFILSLLLYSNIFCVFSFKCYWEASFSLCSVRDCGSICLDAGTPVVPEISLFHRHIVQSLLCVMEGRLPLRTALSMWHFSYFMFVSCLLLWAAASLHSVPSPVMDHNQSCGTSRVRRDTWGIIEVQLLGSLPGGWN